MRNPEIVREVIAEDDPLFTFHHGYAVPTSGPTDAESLEAELYDP